MHRLTAFLLNPSKFNQVPGGWHNAQLFFEFGLGPCEQIFALADFALGDSPDSIIFVLEIGATGMSKQYFKPASFLSEHQEPSAYP
jgi:hypothetical protein